MALAYPFIDTNSLLIDEVDIYFLNAQYTNPDLHAVMGELVNMQPGLVSIVELPEGMGEMMLDAGYEPVYEYIDKELSMGLYKQIGIKGVTCEVIDNGIYPIGKAQTPFGVLYTIHPFPPLKMSLWHDQVEHFERVTQMIKQWKQDFVLVGDFNTTTFSPIFQKYFWKYKFDMHYTWLTNTPIALPLDYVVSNKMFLSQKGRDIGSDHRGLMVDILR